MIVDSVSRFNIGLRTKQIVDFLKKVPIGGEVTYSELSDVIGESILSQRGRGTLASARKILHNTSNIVFGVNHGTGLWRKNDEEKVAAGISGLTKIRRACKRTAREVISVDNYDKLPQESKVIHNHSLSMLGALRHMTSIKQQNRVAKVVSDAMTQIDHTKLFEICK